MEQKNGEKESESSPKSKSGKTSSSSSSSGPNKDFLQTELPGEPTDSVPVYDTCDDVRRKVAAWLREPKVTQAQFCRDLHAQMHTDEKKGASASANSLQSFRGHSGPVEGGTAKFSTRLMFSSRRRGWQRGRAKRRRGRRWRRFGLKEWIWRSLGLGGKSSCFFLFVWEGGFMY